MAILSIDKFHSTNRINKTGTDAGIEELLQYIQQQFSYMLRREILEP